MRLITSPHLVTLLSVLPFKIYCQKNPIFKTTHTLSSLSYFFRKLNYLHSASVYSYHPDKILFFYALCISFTSLGVQLGNASLICHNVLKEFNKQELHELASRISRIRFEMNSFLLPFICLFPNYLFK